MAKTHFQETRDEYVLNPGDGNFEIKKAGHVYPGLIIKQFILIKTNSGT